MALLYANEQFPRRVVIKLREFGHDILTVQVAGQANQRIPQEASLHGQLLRIYRPMQ